MGEKKVDEVPGIGPAMSENLRKSSRHGSITKAYQLYGHFLVFEKDEEKFKAFIMEHGGDKGSQKAAYEAFKEWDASFN